MRLGPSLNGLDVLRAYKAIQPESEVILITAFGSMETAIEAVKAGAFDYISKPFKIDEVLLQVQRALGNRKLLRENRSLKRQLGTQVQLSSLVGNSPKMLEIYKKIAMVADSRSTVLIYGASGTGKELVAKAIHYNGPRAEQCFYAVNCGALTETLLETELFGHVRGAFTGATENKARNFRGGERRNGFPGRGQRDEPGAPGQSAADPGRTGSAAHREQLRRARFARRLGMSGIII